ncbi:MAG TPA: RecQ family ATP-dependent DNA helicase [Ktedonobacteraceae bacterium]|nr:RecQ family ATP-dependent DNA helicase [Ktedonobacteraceae bacterium]
MLHNSWQNCSPEKLLVERFHIMTGFHPGQRTIIEQLVQGRRILAIQQTGWGKSLCYQMASLYYPHLTIVFSPLKALMRDQCQRCNDVYDIPSAIVSSDFSEAENDATLAQAVEGEIKVLYIAPERLSNIAWQNYVSQMRISMIVIDEAHCISTWGHDFRPDYRRIVRLLDALPENTAVLALTATANKRVEVDILQQMGIGVHVMRGTMLRSNLYLHVVHVQGDQEKLGYLAEMLPRSPGTGIIYTATRPSAEMVAAFLQRQGLTAEYYHGGRDNDVRQEIEQKWMANQYKVVCSTNALGMGIDKSDIRFIIHYHIPGSLIPYYQEVGRAGRDGQVAQCVLLYDPEDLRIQEHFISHAKPASLQYETILSHLEANSQGLSQNEIMRITGFSQTVTRVVLKDLEDQGFIERDAKSRYVMVIERPRQIDFSNYDTVRQQKLRELSDIQNYVLHQGCYMAYLTTYLGDPLGLACGVCGQCQPTNFPTIQVSESIQEAAVRFLEDEYLPQIEKRGTTKTPAHEAGWALSAHGTSRIGRLVRVCKYESAGPFPLSLVTRAVEVLYARYPIAEINGIIGIPPTRSGTLVEDFARQVAAMVSIEYLPALTKIRDTLEQKYLKNRLQKEDNVKGVFAIQSPELVAGRTLLLIDDIYDSGKMLQEAGRTLMRAGARVVYPLTITRTLHSDDQ